MKPRRTLVVGGLVSAAVSALAAAGSRRAVRRRREHGAAPAHSPASRAFAGAPCSLEVPTDSDGRPSTDAPPGH